MTMHGSFFGSSGMNPRPFMFDCPHSGHRSRCVAPSGSFVMSTLTNGGFVGGGVLAFLAFAAFWAKSGELRARRQRMKTRRMVRERNAGGDVAALRLGGCFKPTEPG